MNLQFQRNHRAYSDFLNLDSLTKAQNDLIFLLVLNKQNHKALPQPEKEATYK